MELTPRNAECFVTLAVIFLIFESHGVISFPRMTVVLSFFKTETEVNVPNSSHGLYTSLCPCCFSALEAWTNKANLSPWLVLWDLLADMFLATLTCLFC